MTETEIKEIVQKQRSYFYTGATLPVEKRLDALKKLKTCIQKYEPLINEALKRDLGKSNFESYMCEVGLVLSELSYMIRHTPSYAKEKTVLTPLAQFASRSYKKPSPYGVVLVMSPWNYPFLLTIDPLIDAIAAGKQGAISIHRFVQPHSSLTIGRNRNDFIELDKNDIKVENYDNSSRQIPGHNDSIDTKHSFRDAKLVFTEEQVKAETARCLGCGASVVDQNKCIGCGICTTKCEFDAIKLHRELPGCSKMVPSEDKLKYILPNGAKQAIKIKFSKKK